MSSSAQDLLPPPSEVNDSHKVYSFGIMCSLMCALGTISVLGRLAIRYHFRNFGADDYAIIPALVLFFSWGTMASFLCFNVGVGKPLWEITVHEYTMWLKGQIACIWLYPAMSGSIRISVLLFYRRIFGVNRTTTRLIWALIILQGVYIIGFSISPAFLCSNFNQGPYTWATNCSLHYFTVTQTTLYTASLALDTILFLLPVYPMAKLQMGPKSRTKVITIFSVGAAATIVAAYKLAVSIREWVHLLPPDSPFWKYQLSLYVPGQYSVYGTTFWVPSILEPTIAIVATSLPAFRQLKSSIAENSKTRQGYTNTSGFGSLKNDTPKKRGLNSNSTSSRRDFINISNTDLELEDQHESMGRARGSST